MEGFDAYESVRALKRQACAFKTLTPDSWVPAPIGLEYIAEV